MASTDDIDLLLESALTRAGAPLSAAAARKALPVGKKAPANEVVERLRRLVAAGRVHRWPGKAEKFSSADPSVLAREEVQRVLVAGPRTEAEIKKLVSKPARPLVKAALTQLTEARRVQRHPKLRNRVRYGLGPADPLDYLPAAIESAFKPLKKLGFTDSELRVALQRYAGAERDTATADVARTERERTPSDEVILAAMSALNRQASRGALVDIKDLRAALADRVRDKASFDRAILDLAARGRVQLQSHAWPGRLSDHEKMALIPNDRGGFFDAIGLRLE